MERAGYALGIERTINAPMPLFNMTTLRARIAPGIIRLRRPELRIILSTWTGELQRYPGIAAQLARLGAEICEQPPPDLRLPGHMLHQVMALDLGLSRLDDDVFTLKTRPDICGVMDVHEFLDLQPEPALPGRLAAPFGHRVHVVGMFGAHPLYINDILYAGMAGDLRRLCLLPFSPGLRYPRLAPEQWLWATVFAPGNPVLAAYLAVNPGLIFDDAARQAELRAVLSADPLFARAIAVSVILMRDSLAFLHPDPDSAARKAACAGHTLETLLWQSVPGPSLDHHATAATNTWLSAALVDAVHDGHHAASPLGARVRDAIVRYGGTAGRAALQADRAMLDEEAACLADSLRQRVGIGDLRNPLKAASGCRVTRDGSPWEVTRAPGGPADLQAEEINHLRRVVDRLQSQLARCYLHATRVERFMTAPKACRMRLFRRAVSLALLICLQATLASAQPATVAKRDGVWAQSYVDRGADPDVRFGQLGNGMRFAIQHNATPTQHTSLRLLIRSGSLAEREDQRGLAHFLEHMAFRGSKNVPAGDMIRILQRLGLSFGADTNAHTGLDETVYQFDLPKSDPETIGTGLMLLREIAGELTLAQSEMDPERGVVLSEERVRDGPGYRRGVAELSFQLDGQLPPRRMPIGDVDILRNAPVSLIREFYEAEYRPDNATVVAVGDFDVDTMEAAIRGRFEGWAAKQAAPRPPELGEVPTRGPTVRILAAPGTPRGLSLAWVAPYDNAADTLARERRDVAEGLAIAVLRNRMEALAQSDDAPFLTVAAGRSGVYQAATMTVINVQPKPDGWKPALEATIAAQRGLASSGVRPDELTRATSEFMTGIRVAAEGAQTRPSPRIADDIVRAASSGDLYTNPAQDLAEATLLLDRIDRAEVEAAAKRLFAGSGPLVFLAGPDPVAGGEAAVEAALAEAAARPIQDGQAEAPVVWPYSASPPGAVAARGGIADLGVVSVRFANNVRLLVKRTDFARDEVLVLVRIGNGRLGIAPEQAKNTWMVSGTVPMLTSGGTKELTREDIQKLTSANRVEIRQSLEDDAFVLSGTTRPADLDRQMQLLQATTTQPGLRPLAFNRVKASLGNQLPQIEATASGVFGRAAAVALHGGDLRFQRIPDSASLAAATVEDLGALIRKDFAEGPIELTIVGDIEVERAIDAVARSFGALPERKMRGPAGERALAVRFPQPTSEPISVPHGGRADQAVAMAAWPTDDFFADLQAQRNLGMLTAVLQSRLTDRLRTQDGVTYSPAAFTDASDTFKGYGFLQAMVETPVDKVPRFYSELDSIVEALRTAPVTADEMDRAKRPRVDRRIRALRENQYWIGALSGAHRDERQFDAIRDLVPGTERVTAADVQAAAVKYLRPGGSYRLTVRPGG
eukprot:gene1344-1361_t